jgi:hypothetical protein
VGHRACLDDVEKRKYLTLPGLELRHLGRPARSQSLYYLCKIVGRVEVFRIEIRPLLENIFRVNYSH